MIHNVKAYGQLRSIRRVRSCLITTRKFMRWLCDIRTLSYIYT